MAKGIIVVDMPEICENCLFSRTHAAPLQDCLYCTVLTRGVIRKNQIKRPNWCPIKPMPEIAYRHEKGEPGQRNYRIVDDLIGRKAAYKAFSDYLNRNYIGEISSQTELSIGEIASVIKSIPTAYDQVKVIEQLKEEGCIVDDEAGHRVVEIIEKGGLN